jgi:cell division septal protein FtsQ
MSEDMRSVPGFLLRQIVTPRHELSDQAKRMARADSRRAEQAWRREHERYLREQRVRWLKVAGAVILLAVLAVLLWQAP